MTKNTKSYKYSYSNYHPVTKFTEPFAAIHKIISITSITEKSNNNQNILLVICTHFPFFPRTSSGRLVSSTGEGGRQRARHQSGLRSCRGSGGKRVGGVPMKEVKVIGCSPRCVKDSKMQDSSVCSPLPLFIAVYIMFSPSCLTLIFFPSLIMNY